MSPAEKNGYFADTGASFVLQGNDRRLAAPLPRWQARAWTGIRQVQARRRLQRPRHRYRGIRPQEPLLADPKPREPRCRRLAPRTPDRNPHMA